MDRLFWIVIAVLGGGLLLLLFNHSSGETLGLDNDRFGSLVYLGALALVIGAGVLGSPPCLGRNRCAASQCGC